MPMPRRLLLLVIVLTAGSATGLPAAEEPGFDAALGPFVKSYCVGCHGPRKKEAKLDLSAEASARSVVRHYRVWDRVVERLESGEMPPEDHPKQPTPKEREAAVAWLKGVRAAEAKKNAGDPGPVLARRLSNAEYDNAVRDLTGVDLRPTREFPVDPADEAGFDNSGESLAMSPALLKKYLDAARRVADHLVLRPEGFAFAPHPVVTDTDRDKYCVRRIVDFYDRHRVDLADYFLAAWLRARGKTAGPRRLPPRNLRKTLPSGPGRPPARRAGRALERTSGRPGRRPTRARRGCERMRDRVVRLRKKYPSDVGRLQVKGISPGSQPLVLWSVEPRGRLAAGRSTGGPTRAPGPRRVLPGLPERVL